MEVLRGRRNFCFQTCSDSSRNLSSSLGLQPVALPSRLGLVRSRNCTSQWSLPISLCAHTPCWFCFSGEPWLIQVVVDMQRKVIYSRDLGIRTTDVCWAISWGIRERENKHGSHLWAWAEEKSAMPFPELGGWGTAVQAGIKGSRGLGGSGGLVEVRGSVDVSGSQWGYRCQWEEGQWRLGELGVSVGDIGSVGSVEVEGQWELVAVSEGHWGSVEVSGD